MWIALLALPIIQQASPINAFQKLPSEDSSSLKAANPLKQEQKGNYHTSGLGEEGIIVSNDPNVKTVWLVDEEKTFYKYLESIRLRAANSDTIMVLEGNRFFEVPVGTHVKIIDVSSKGKKVKILDQLTKGQGILVGWVQPKNIKFPFPDIGKEGVIDGGPQNDTIFLATNENTHIKFIKSWSDRSEIAKLLAQGQVFKVNRGIRVKVIDTGTGPHTFRFSKSRPKVTKVRILEGQHQGKLGLVYTEWIKFR